MKTPFQSLMAATAGRLRVKGLFNSLPFEEQFKARRGYDEGATGYTTDIPGVGRVDFDLRAIFSFPPGKPPGGPESMVEVKTMHLEKLIPGAVIRVDPAMDADKCVIGSFKNGKFEGAVMTFDASKPVQVYESNWPYDVAGTGFDVEPPNNTPRGLLMVAPMDGRMGWRN